MVPSGACFPISAVAPGLPAAPQRKLITLAGTFTPSPMDVVLVMFRPDGSRREFHISRDETVIGRREDCHLRVPLPDVSRRHCRLLRGESVLRVEDLASSNGTFVNFRRIQLLAEVKAGDVLSVGKVDFVLQVNSFPPDADLRPPVHRSATASPGESSEFEAASFRYATDGPTEEMPADVLVNFPGR